MMSARTMRRLQIGVALGMLVFIVLVTWVLLRSTLTVDKVSVKQDDNSTKNAQQAEVLREIKSLAADIRSCTTPGQECSRRGAKQTAQAIAAIGVGNRKSAAAAASCAISEKKPTYENIYACITREIDGQ